MDDQALPHKITLYVDQINGVAWKHLFSTNIAYFGQDQAMARSISMHFCRITIP